MTVTPSAAVRELGARERRSRLLDAMVVACDQQGYENTTVADLLALAEVSRGHFYTLFESKDDCFVATLEALLEAAVDEIAGRLPAEEMPEERGRAALTAIVDLVAAQPAAARLCIVETLASGGVGQEQTAAAFERFTGLAHASLRSMEGREGLSEDLSLGVLGGIYQVLYRRLLERRDTELAEIVDPLWDWLTSYYPPPVPLRLRGRRPKPSPASGAMPPFAELDPAERIIRAFADAVAESGYQATTIAEIARRASISQRTFYEYFAGKPDLLTAALDSSGAQLAAATLPAIRRSPGWPQSVRAGFGASCRFLAAEPSFARLRLTEIYSTERTAIFQRDAAGATVLDAVLAGDGAPRVDPFLREAIAGAVYALVYRQIVERGPETLPELAPLLTYMSLVPVIGPAQAAEVANGDGR
jgi:AcrR family transcriptional regulator